MAEDDTGGGRPPLIERVRARQADHRRRSAFIRVPFAVGGFGVMLLGVVMLFTPGPGWALIIFGLGLLALEFDWAERLLERVIRYVDRATDQVTKGSPARRAAVIAVGVAVLAAGIAVVVFWDIPFFPG